MMPPSTPLQNVRRITGSGSQQVPPSTAYKRVAAGGASSQQILQAQAGRLTGPVKPSTQALGRQVLDRTFFISELRQKRQQVISVTIQMRVSHAPSAVSGPRQTLTMMVTSLYSPFCMLLFDSNTNS
jgi:hypothetical protein